MVGGEQEQIRAERGRHIAYVLARKGFIRLAIQHGTPIVPCYNFGEGELYDTSSFAFGFRKWLVSTFHVAIPLFVGRWWWCPWFPRRVPLVTCVGKPIPVAKGDPTEAGLVEEVHQRYVQELKGLFDRNKQRLGYTDAVLEII